VLVLMVVVLLWSGALAAGFGFAAVTGAESLGLGRRTTYYLLSGFMALLATRTAYELWRRLTHR
jgi:sterol desaturase/sphingolipid hydroxylase (fatty acid hydroxylase superfamily)